MKIEIKLKDAFKNSRMYNSKNDNASGKLRANTQTAHVDLGVPKKTFLLFYLDQ